MIHVRAARARTGAAGLAAAVALAGCSQQAASTSSLTATGRTLSIWISLPPNIAGDPAAQQVVDAEQLAYAAHHSEVSAFGLRLRFVGLRKLTDNARHAISDKSSVAYLGELAPGDSEQTVGITNAVDLLQVSPTDTALELTTRTPAVPGAPDRYLETLGTYGRTFARVAPDSAAEAAAQVAAMRALHVSRLSVLNDGTDYGRAIAYAVASDATAAGITVAKAPIGEATQGLFYGGGPLAAAAAFTKASSESPNLRMFGGSALDSPAFVTALGSHAGSAKVYVSAPTVPAAGLRTLRAAFTAGASAVSLKYPLSSGQPIGAAAVYGYEAMAAVLSAIASAGRQANVRAKVITAFDGIRNRSSLIGTYSLDKAGSTTLGASAFAVLQLRGGTFVPLTHR